jgi:uncharacterized protein YxeA
MKKLLYLVGLIAIVAIALSVFNSNETDVEMVDETVTEETVEEATEEMAEETMEDSEPALEAEAGAEVEMEA